MNTCILDACLSCCDGIAGMLSCGEHSWGRQGMGPHQRDRPKGQPGCNVVMLGVLHIVSILEVRDIPTPSPWKCFNISQ